MFKFTVVETLRVFNYFVEYILFKFQLSFGRMGKFHELICAYLKRMLKMRLLVKKNVPGRICGKKELLSFCIELAMRSCRTEIFISIKNQFYPMSRQGIS